MKNLKGLFQNKKTIIAVVTLTLVLLAIASSYAFFTGITNNDKKQEAKLATGTMALTFKDGNNGVKAKLMLGESVTKKFIIENTGSLEASLSLDWDQLINTYMDGSLTYRLVRTENDVEVEEIIPETNMPVSKEKLTQTLTSELSVPSKETYYYDLIITLNNLDVDQESDKEAVYNTHFNVNKPLQYRYYTLIVNPNGGTWKEFTTSQSYLLKNNETKNIENPTRVGYTFDGWELKGTSSTYDSGIFTMGISDASLTAKWTAEKYTVTIDPAGGDYDGDREIQVDYGSSVTLSEPTKTGYTFSHWETTGGALNDNTLTITDPNDVTVTAKWTPNKYSYIVRHNKQNIDGNGYTTYETETDLQSEYGSTVTPEYKSYEGFTSPTKKKTITIKEDNSLNIVEYNYDRIKYTLTVNPDGGEGGTQTQEVYYENTIDLVAPTRVGYDFQKWTVESGTGTITDNTFKMGIGNTTIKANWKAQEYSLTFNANGGTVNPGSKTITYNSPYGELPIPTKDDFVFLGWYTTNEKTGGTQIKETTIVSATSAQTIYARWGNNTLLAVDTSYAGKIWEHKTNISKVIFENTMIVPSTYEYSYDISKDDDTSVMAYLVTDEEDSTKYIARIQANGIIHANPNSSWLFYNFYNLKNIDGLEYFDTSSATEMFGTFYNCRNLTNLDLTNFNTSNVTDMNMLFYCCSKLTNVNLSNFDTSNVTNMRCMFGSCYSMTSINLNNLNTSKVTNMEQMFYGCSSLTNLDLSFDTSNVTNMKYMFYNCDGLTELDLSKLNTKNLINANGMFACNDGLTNLNFNNFNTSNITDMSEMFDRCINLKTLDLSSFDTKNVTNMYRMFMNCEALTSLNLSSFNTSNVITMEEMFYECTSLTNINLSNFDTSNVTNIGNMFNYCKNLRSLDLSNFNTSKVTNMGYMFSGCSNLTSLDIRNWNVSSVTSKNSMFHSVPSSIKITVSSSSMRTWVINISNTPKLTSSNFYVW